MPTDSIKKTAAMVERGGGGGQKSGEIADVVYGWSQNIRLVLCIVRKYCVYTDVEEVLIILKNFVIFFGLSMLFRP